MTDDEKAEMPAKKMEYSLKLESGACPIELNLEGFVKLNEDERRMVVLARSLATYNEDLPKHRRIGIAALLEAYTSDYILTKTLMALRNTGF